MSTDKENSINDEVKRSDEFQKRINLKEDIINFLKEALVSVTDSVFEKAGYKKNDKHAGEYGDGSKYGAGAVENTYIVKIAGKTKSFLTKEIIIDGKSIISNIEVVYKNNVIEFIYKTTEQGFFRGVDKNGKTYTINETLSFDLSNINNLKTKLKQALKEFTEKELGYVSSTKLGVSDKSGKSTSSVVENNNMNMKKLTIKELFEMDFDSDINMEPNSDKIQGLNTIDLKDTTPPIDSDKKLFFDDKEINETGEWDDSDADMVAWKDSMEEVIKEIEGSTNGKLQLIGIRGFDKYQGPIASVMINGVPYKIFNTNNMLWIENFPIDNTSIKGNRPGFEGSVEEIADAVEQDSKGDNQLKTIPGTDFSMNEITTAGPTITDSPGGHKNGAQSGAGGYNTPKAFKKTPYFKAQSKRPKVTHDYKVTPQNESDNEVEDTKEDSKETKSSNKFTSEPKKSSSTSKDVKSEQPSNKNSAVAEPQSNKNFDLKNGNSTWSNTNQSKAPKSSNDDFWTEVDLIPGSGYVPKGMDQNYVAGMHARTGELKKMGLAENTKPDLTKKKFFSLNENQEKGINKRYLVTEKTTEQYEKERWNKLTNFKSRESINEAEEMNTYFDLLSENKDPEKTILYKKALNENVIPEDLFEESILTPFTPSDSSEDTIEVDKPNSKFGLTYKFFKKDFMNEQRAFILDLNSKVYVANPNAKK